MTVVEGDLQRAGDALAGPFDLIYSMTAIYAAPDQAAVFRELGALAAPGAELRLLEYADPEGRFAEATSGDPTWGWWHPLVPRDLPELLTSAGWTSVAVRDLHPEFVHWYQRPVRPHRREATRDRARSSAATGTSSSRASTPASSRWSARGVLGGVLVRARAADGASPSAPAGPEPLRRATS